MTKTYKKQKQKERLMLKRMILSRGRVYQEQIILKFRIRNTYSITTILKMET